MARVEILGRQLEFDPRDSMACQPGLAMPDQGTRDPAMAALGRDRDGVQPAENAVAARYRSAGEYAFLARDENGAGGMGEGEIELAFEILGLAAEAASPKSQQLGPIGGIERGDRQSAHRAGPVSTGVSPGNPHSAHEPS